MALVYCKLKSAIERDTKPDALDRKSYHWTSPWKAAMVAVHRVGEGA
jgi:hypothetical protein